MQAGAKGLRSIGGMTPDFYDGRRPVSNLRRDEAKAVCPLQSGSPFPSNHDLIRSMRTPTRAFLLGPLLKGVSRSFYLTLRVLPAAMRDPVGLAYLLARAADTIADTSLVPPAQRLDLLLSLRDQVNGAPDQGALTRMTVDIAGRQTQSDEKVLLESLGPALAVLSQLDEPDRDAVRDIVTTLTQGMEFDLRTFPDEYSGGIVALQEPAELDRYTYLVAGCVGEFWTTMTYAHAPGVLKGDSADDVEPGRPFRKSAADDQRPAGLRQGSAHGALLPSRHHAGTVWPGAARSPAAGRFRSRATAHARTGPDDAGSLS